MKRYYSSAVKGIFILVFIAASAILISCIKNKDSYEVNKQEMVYHCPMHTTYLSHEPGNCPLCGMKLVPVYENEGGGNAIRIDPAMIQNVGVQTEKAAIRTLTRDIRTSATIMPDERRVTVITVKVMGYAEKLFVNYTGQRVKKGQPLFDLYSPELVSAQTEYLIIYNNRQTTPDRQEILQSARRRLLNWDVTENQIAELEKRGAPEKNVTIFSPADGIVTEKMVVSGQSIDPGMQLYKIVDFSRVWVECAVYQHDVSLVSVGQTGIIELDYYPGEQFDGIVTYIAPEFDMESRTLMVRLELANTHDIRIKSGMNASVTIHAVLKRKSVTVPDQAVIYSGLRTLIVAARGGGYFEPRQIKTGQTAGGYTEIIDGVQDGEEIVVSSQFLIDSESSLKAAVRKLTSKNDSAVIVPHENLTDYDTVKNGRKQMMETENKPGVNHGNANSAHGHPDKETAAAKQIYTCPMDPEIISDKPDLCPKCGMKLVLKKQDPEKKKTVPDKVDKMDNMPGM